ncbi:hypothetical protein N7520_000649 [Penicillium odoratum]|uniref:uncharacterized protein n=1 Tax=Penicillium odoratum TaxID=1167516 RepID=UPI0025484B14|nr:uncharacterized protein N7520_000649 [Penicillium odoratum]KAJ5777403.1 hypothetical protein N7520_000649 [Penicillium odoratum]
MSVIIVGLDLSSNLPIILSSTFDLAAEMDTFDLDCFDVDLAAEAIGSSATTILSIITKLRKEARPATFYVKFTNVPPQVSDKELSKGCRQMFNPENRTLIVTVPSVQHEAAAGNFSRFFTQTTIAANIPIREFSSCGSTRVKGICCSKEPDGSFYVTNFPSTGGKQWPTVVVEVGLSESKRKPRADAAWWIANSKGEVNVVITISISKSIAKVVFEAIVLIHPTPMLRSGPRYQSTVRQSIVLSRPLGGQNKPISTTPQTPLRISCQELLRRSAVPPETDPDIPVQTLEDIAWFIWKFQDV